MEAMAGAQTIVTDHEVIELPAHGEGDDEWQSYVSNAPNASLYHRLEWRDILLRTFGHRARYLMARRNGRVAGVFPLIEMSSPLFGHFFVSLPFVNFGGIVADTPEVETALASAATHLFGKTSAKHIEVRQSSPGNSWPASGWHLRQHKAALVLPIQSDPEPHWTGLSSRLRGKVRKAEKSGAGFSVTAADGLADFYRVFALNMRDLGTPVYTPALFRNVLGMWPESSVLLVHLNGKPVAGAIAVRRGGHIELPWICSDYSRSSSYVNEYLYWKSIEWACSTGGVELDFGRSSVDAGTYRFKIQWNPEVRPLFWYYWLAPGTELPVLNPSNPKYELAVRWWKKMPVEVANRIGPWIVRNIP
jgi:FemAB-related protein (PEP-CTERM system-associated)